MTSVSRRPFDGYSFDVRPGRGPSDIVGESGSQERDPSLSILRLIPVAPCSASFGGSIRFNGLELAHAHPTRSCAKEMPRQRDSMIFQSR